MPTTLQFQVATAYLYENLKVKIEKEQVGKESRSIEYLLHAE